MKTPQDRASAWVAAVHASRFNYTAGIQAGGGVPVFVNTLQWIADYLDDLDALPACAEPDAK